MTAAYFFLLYSILTFSADSCPTSYPFSCGNVTLDIRYPFFTNISNHQCPGLHHIDCMNLTPVILFHRQEFIFPLYDILYPEKAVIVHDLKLSAFFRGSDCVFLYNFTHPIPLFNVSYLSQLINSGQSFFNCELQEYDFSHDIFNQFYNSTFCNDYILYYSYQSEGHIDDGSSHNCSTSGNLWFDWKLSFSEEKNNGDISLLSAGFSREWLLIPDCFNCRITGGDCHSSDGARNSTCFQGMKQSNNGRNRKITAIVATGTVASILACAICIFCYRQKQKKHSSSTVPFKSFSPDSPSEKDPELVSSGYQTHLFSYDELLEATNSFDASKELGDGGFGTVYKGKLRDGRIVAVKRLYDNNCKRVEQFLNEVVILSQLRHRSLVTLYGCTSRRSRELLLVYEFISNGTVADHLHGSPSPDPALTWPLRLRIAVESADALAYLHAIDPPIIHRDVKTTNILLDDDFHVKVADFGLSRLFPVDATHVSTAPQGTPGYVDPEYHQYYQLTDKSDVYSFGVVLIELISSKPAVDVSRHRDEINLSSMAMKKIQEGRLDHLVDPALGFESDKEVRRMITVVAELAFRCLQIDREMRPTIKEVLEELRRIESGDYREEEKGGKGGDAGVLLQRGEPFSPDTVIERWFSRSSTLSTRSG